MQYLASVITNPSTGRWLSRDPFEEQGGRNLYGFNDNNPVCFIDPLGLASFRFEVVVGTFSLSAGSGAWSQPWWAGSGSYSITANSASTSVSVNNASSSNPLHPDRDDYCNTVDFGGAPGNAGGIKLYARDDCQGGSFRLTFDFSVTLSGSGPIKSKALAFLRNEGSTLFRGEANAGNGNRVNMSTAFILPVTLVKGQEKMVVFYDPIISFPFGKPSTTSSAEVSISGVKLEATK